MASSTNSKKMANIMGSSNPSKGSGSMSQSAKSMGTVQQQQLFSKVGYYRGTMVAIKHINKEHIQVSRKVLLELNDVSSTLASMYL